MNVDRLITLFAMVTLVELMLTIGLGATVPNVWAVVSDWRGVARAFTANYLLVPAAAVALALLFKAPPMVAAGVMVVAACPGAPYGPPLTALAKGRVDRAVGLMVVLAGSSALLAPLLLRLLLPVVSGGHESVNAGRVVSMLALTQFLPLSVGLWVAARRPRWAQRLKTPLGRLSTLLNISLVALILAVQYPMLALIRPRGYLGMFLLLAASASAGWLLGRPGTGERRTLAVTTSVRNVGVGLLIAGSSFPGTPAVTFTTAYGLFQIVLTALVIRAICRREPVVETAAAGVSSEPSPGLLAQPASPPAAAIR